MTIDTWKERVRKEFEADKLRKKPVTDRLLAKGVKLAVSGCGCCGSPSVTIIIDGETLVKDVEDYNISLEHYDDLSS